MIKSVDNVMIYYDEIGSPNNPTILFIHAAFMGRIAFAPQFNDRRLVDKFHLVRMDSRGAGRSSKPTNISMYDSIYNYADDLNAVIQDVTKSYLKKKVVLVGWSFGFPTSLAYLDKYGYDKVAGLVSSAGLVNPKIGLNQTALASLDQLISNDYTKAITSIEGDVDTAITAKPFDEKTRLMFIGVMAIVPPVAKQGLVRTSFDFKPVLKRANIPVLVIYGDKDILINRGYPKTMAKAAKKAVIKCYHNVAHFPSWESARQFNTDLTTFVSQL
ncbi:9551_t:CDS:2 [Paraglomus brasilianum]|uniref:9551_t:CDS:1 n=1 Tax=Paraglomus brasilianum TaxID=144538 RepID=A0A9N8Z8K7_9GLOM|nr:9551_t:CDS:2 [Paraglomus brasilianum]